MSYITKNLLNGEEIVCKAKIHWSIFIIPALLIAATIYLYAGAAHANKNAAWGTVTLFLAVYFGASALVYFLTTELAVTNKRVIAKIGFIKRTTIEMMHDKVESLNLDQSIMGRILGFGTILINGTGGKSAPIKSIDSPMEFRKQALELVDKTD